jgi:ArsR family transcriptional regulator
MATEMTPEMLELVAQRFHALGEPARLQLMNALRSGEQTVNALVEETDLSTANISKHLQILHAAGFVTRRKEGVRVYYRLAGKDVLRLCDIMCGRVEAEAERRHRTITGRLEP